MLRYRPQTQIYNQYDRLATALVYATVTLADALSKAIRLTYHLSSK